MITVAITEQSGWTKGTFLPSMVIKDDGSMDVSFAPVILEGYLKSPSSVPSTGVLIGKCGFNPGLPYFNQPYKTFLVAHDKGSNPVKLEVRNNGEIYYRGGLYTEQAGATIFLDGINFFLGDV